MGDVFLPPLHFGQFAGQLLALAAHRGQFAAQALDQVGQLQNASAHLAQLTVELLAALGVVFREFAQLVGVALLHLIDLLAQVQNGAARFVVLKQRGPGGAKGQQTSCHADSSQGQDGDGWQSGSPLLQR